MLRDSQILWAIVFGLLFASPLWFMVYHSASVTIEKPYFNEWSICEERLTTEIMKNTPSCAPCECKMGASSLVFTIFGIVFGLAGYGLYFYMLYKSNKLEDKKSKEIEEREKVVTKDEAELYKKFHPTKGKRNK